MVRYEPFDHRPVTSTCHLRTQAEAFERGMKRAKGPDAINLLTGSAQKVIVSEVISGSPTNHLPCLANGDELAILSGSGSKRHFVVSSSPTCVCTDSPNGRQLCSMPI